MWPLTDITIYSDHESVDKDFARKANYICDLYHNRLDGYKPPKTSRICLHLSTLTINRPPIYIGSICEHYCHFNYENYEKLASKLKQFACILDLAHQAVMELAEIFKWDKTPFIRSYESIIIDNFRFIKEYPIKKSKDRCNAGQAILEKTVSDVTLSVKIVGNENFESILIEKKNWFWYDSSYRLASQMKWIDNNSFGFKSKTLGAEVYFSIKDKKVFKNFDYKEDDF